jgi:hypothetical protein
MIPRRSAHTLAPAQIRPDTVVQGGGVDHYAIKVEQNGRKWKAGEDQPEISD